MPSVFVDYHSHSEDDRERDPNDEWDFPNTHTTYDSITLHSKSVGWMEEVPVDFPVSEGDRLWLVYAIYSSGNSLQMRYDGYIEFICAFKTYDGAVASQQLIANANSRVDLKTETGKDLSFFPPWLGFFDSLSEVCVEGFVVS